MMMDPNSRATAIPSPDFPVAVAPQIVTSPRGNSGTILSSTFELLS